MVNSISGLYIVQNFISGKEEKTLMKIISGQEWDKSLSRWTQQYGYKYNYKKRGVLEDDYIGELPEWLKSLCEKMNDVNEYSGKEKDQVIINQYRPSEGIAKHKDAPIFDDEICSISLGSQCTMIFRKGTDVHEILLKPRSLLIMTGDARYKYTHKIKKVKTDRINGKRVYRGIRISITFRKMLLK